MLTAHRHALTRNTNRHTTHGALSTSPELGTEGLNVDYRGHYGYREAQNTRCCVTCHHTGLCRIREEV